MPSGTTAPVCSLSVPSLSFSSDSLSSLPRSPLPPRPVSFPRKTFLFPSFRKASSDHVKGHDRGVLLPPSGDYSFNQGKRVAHRFAGRKIAVQQLRGMKLLLGWFRFCADRWCDDVDFASMVHIVLMYIPIVMKLCLERYRIACITILE